jgi:tetratricopeptide (TPR) repeat protein
MGKVGPMHKRGPGRRAGLHRITILVGIWIFCTGSFPANAQILTVNDLRTQLRVYTELATRADPPAMAALPAGRIWFRLGSLYQDAGLFVQSEMAYVHAIRLLKIAPVSPSSLAEAIDCLGTLYRVRGDLPQAEHAEAEALLIREANGLSEDLPRSWYRLAALYLSERRLREAGEYATRAVAQLRAMPPSDPDELIQAQIVLGLALCRLHRYPESIVAMKGALEVVGYSYQSTDFSFGFTEFMMGDIYWRSGNRDAAQSLLREGAELVQNQLGWTHPTTVAIMTEYEHFLRSIHHKDTARSIAKCLKQARHASGVNLGSDMLNVASIF